MSVSVSAPVSRIMTFDLGGNTKRVTQGAVFENRHVDLVRLETTRDFAVHSSQELFQAIHGDVLAHGMTDINTLIISIAGPVSPDKLGVVCTFPNQPLVDNEDVPVGREVARLLRQTLGRHINVWVVNDGDVGTEAEFSPEGVLGQLKDGDYGSCIIVGNGVGGRLYMKAGNVLMPMDGLFEPGHWRVTHRTLDKLGLFDFEGIPCGCGLTGNRASERDVCGEWLTKGPALELFFRLKTGMLGLTNKEALAYLKQEKPLDENRWRKLKDVLAGEATLLGEMFADHQTHFIKGPIHFAMISGIGKNFGPLMMPGINAAVEGYQRSKWVHKPVIHVGNFESDQCNSVGGSLIGARHEEHGDKIEYQEAA